MRHNKRLIPKHLHANLTAKISIYPFKYTVHVELPMNRNVVFGFNEDVFSFCSPLAFLCCYSS